VFRTRPPVDAAQVNPVNNLPGASLSAATVDVSATRAEPRAAGPGGSVVLLDGIFSPWTSP
jgi:hypothetical protein